MLNSSKIFSRLKNKWRKNWQGEIVDIFQFGSSVKGKSRPQDIDLCLIFRKEVNLPLVKEISSSLNDKYHLSFLTVNNFFSKPHSLTRTLFLEGKSIFTNKDFSSIYGLSPQLLYIYNLSGIKASKKVRFVYLLRGRKLRVGMVKKWGGEFLSPSSFLVTVTRDNEVQEIFKKWKIKYKRKKIFLMK